MAFIINGAFPLDLLEKYVSKAFIFMRYNQLKEKGLVDFREKDK